MQVSLAVPRRAARRPRLDPRPRLLALVLTRFAAPPRCAGVRARRGAARRGSYRQPADEQQQQREPARPPSRRAAPPRPAPRLASPPTPGTCAHAARLVVQVCGRAAGPRAADRTASQRTSSSSSVSPPARPPVAPPPPAPHPALPHPRPLALVLMRLASLCRCAGAPRGRAPRIVPPAGGRAAAAASVSPPVRPPVAPRPAPPPASPRPLALVLMRLAASLCRCAGAPRGRVARIVPPEERASRSGRVAPRSGRAGVRGRQPPICMEVVTHTVALTPHPKKTKKNDVRR